MQQQRFINCGYQMSKSKIRYSIKSLFKERYHEKDPEIKLNIRC